MGLMRLFHRPFVLLAIALLLAGAAAAVAVAKMTSIQLEPKLCETKGGGKFVEIPGFPGEKIDRRLLNDIEFLEERYKHKLFITDGYSLDPIHAHNGEHPIGLALDIIPVAGASWRKVSRLAKWAEPRPNRPRPPFRWVGYNGDAGHGRGDHLHLSWSHSATSFNEPARTVYTIVCPDQPGTVLTRTDDGGGVQARIRAQQRTAVPERR
jgi:hypothetical protein